jgi:hypothetical protein
VDCCPEMGCHLGWHFAVGCPLRGGRGKYIKKNSRDFCSTKNNSGKKSIYMPFIILLNHALQYSHWYILYVRLENTVIFLLTLFLHSMVSIGGENSTLCFCFGNLSLPHTQST